MNIHYTIVLMLIKIKFIIYIGVFHYVSCFLGDNTFIDHITIV